MKFSSISYLKFIRKLKACGFVLRRHSGSSHEIWWNSKTRKTCVVPRHRDIKPGTLRNIIRQMGLSIEEFEEL